MSRRTGVTTLIMLTTLATLGGRTARAADWSESLDASQYGAFVRNPQLLAGVDVSDEVGVLMLDGSTNAQTETGQFTLTPRLALTRYLHETGLNVDAGSIDFSAIEKLERGQWTFSGEILTDSTVTSELGLTGITYVNRRHDSGSASFGYQYYDTELLSWQLQGAWQTTRYSDGARYGLTNYDYGSVQFGPTLSFSERLQGSLNLEADRISPEVGSVQNAYSASLELKRNFSERYTWHISVGTSRVASGDISSGGNLILDVGASRQGERVQWDLSLKRFVTPIGIGLLAQENEAILGVVASLTERTSLNVSLNIIRSDPVIYLSYLVYEGASWGQASAEWKYQVTQHWALSVAYIQSRARGGTGQPWANGNQGRLGILWQSGRL